MKPALLCIDLQYLCAARDCGIFASPDCPVSKAEQDYYFTRLEQSVLPGVQKLQALFRDRGLEVIHTRTMCQTADGRERSYWHKELGLCCPPGSREAQFLEPVAPGNDDLVISKTASGPFGNTNLHTLLTRLEIGQLYCCGVLTHESVESSIRAAADYGGYCPVLIEDATATLSEHLQQDCTMRLRGRYCEVLQAEKLLEDLEQHIRSVRSKTQYW